MACDAMGWGDVGKKERVEEQGWEGEDGWGGIKPAAIARLSRKL